jgi:hypothetical protein
MDSNIIQIKIWKERLALHFTIVVFTFLGPFIVLGFFNILDAPPLLMTFGAALGAFYLYTTCSAILGSLAFSEDGIRGFSWVDMDLFTWEELRSAHITYPMGKFNSGIRIYEREDPLNRGKTLVLPRRPYVQNMPEVRSFLEAHGAGDLLPRIFP